MNWKVHAISFLVLLFAVAAVKFVWDNPKIILYVVFSAVGILAYGAIYIVVKTRMDTQGKPHKD